MSTMRTKWSLIVLFVAQGSAFCPLLAPLPHLSRQTLANPQRQASTLHSLSTDYLENLDEECDISQVRVGERVYGTLKSNADPSFVPMGFWWPLALVLMPSGVGNP